MSGGESDFPIDSNSNCGTKKDMPLSVRTYDCPACGISLYRYWNASLNILNWEPSA
ncbi:zinc ribbon domain-containing protein [Microcoleus sp. LAD1_D3]|uniref:zinc ribbon domain-containing protein n=1 Tax=unclassified Microcoleus TaxID=2642155 RepID=UPI002FD6579D